MDVIMSKKLKKQLKRIIIAAVIFAVLMVLEHVVAPAHPYVTDEFTSTAAPSLLSVFNNRWVMLVLYLIPYFICGGDVVKTCLSNIKNRRFMDEAFLMTLATVGAFVIGENSEAVAVMLFYQVGEWFQGYAVGKSRRSIKELMDIAPEFANRVAEDGTVEVIDPDEVQIGDTLVIKPGERVPVDGTVIDGVSLVNTAALTGESVPRTVKPGDVIISGCINGDNAVRVRADKQYEDSTVAKILEMVENASNRKSKTENFITRFARYYTPIVVYAALALAIIPSIITRDPATWILRACTFLVISCPCALVISVPLAFFGGIGAASNAGILVKGSNYLELAAGIKTLVTDKTGTLTKGEFKVSEVKAAEGRTQDEVLHLAALAEGLSTHPIAVSIREAYGAEVNLEEVTSSENLSGRGIAATVTGREVLVGNGRLMDERGILYEPIDNGAATVVYVACDSAYIGSIAVSDTIKEGAAEAIRAMRNLGVRKTVMLTGDRSTVAQAVAAELGIDETYAELMPGDKVDVVERLLHDRQGDSADAKEIDTKDVLAFIGDGLNDAPVLSRADVGIAMGSMGSDAAIEAADIVIMDDNLARLPVLMRIANKTIGISKQNIVFAIGIKVLFLILGAVGIANMWWAVFADVGVAVICILNSMRMLGKSA